MGLVTGLAMALGNGLGGPDTGVDGLTWSLAEGGNVFEEQSPAEPDVMVSLASTGGPEPPALQPFQQHSIQITVRGDQDPETARALWWKVFDYLHGKRNVTLGDPDQTYLVWCLSANGNPLRIGPDENGRYRFTMNLRAETQRPSSHRPQTV